MCSGYRMDQQMLERASNMQEFFFNRFSGTCTIPSESVGALYIHHTVDKHSLYLSSHTTCVILGTT